MKKKWLIVVAGPTASGKTSLGISLASKYNAEILSADSRQIYKELNIGVARPSEHELSQVRHHLIATHSIFEPVNAGMFADLSKIILNELFSKNDFAFLVGGSGLYIQALCDGLDQIPPTQVEIRDALNLELKEKGLELLCAELKQIDPDYFQTVDKANPHRVLRGLEVFRITGKPFSSFRKKIKAERDFEIIKIGIRTEREMLYKKIDARVDEMMERGLREEAKELWKHKNLRALQTVGYTELFEYFEEIISLKEAMDNIKQNSRNYAKRQLTWFNRDKEIRWFEAHETNALFTFIDKKIEEG